MSRLGKEEQEILEAFEAGKLERSPDRADLQKRHQDYAEAMFRKDARINIRLSSRDLRGLQKNGTQCSRTPHFFSALRPASASG
jgi:predicted DNA binding CopG/RHH family protein